MCRRCGGYVWTILATGAAVQARGACTYLDHAASVSACPEAAQQVIKDLAGGLGDRTNPSAQHTAGR